MDNPVTKLIEALEASELAEKDEFKRKIVSCIDMLERYYQIVIREEMYYSSRPVEKLNVTMLKTYDCRRRSAHDECIAACKRINEICAILSIEKICNVNVEDRTQVAQFCGYIISNLYFSNIRCDEDLIKWLDSCPLNK
jgi:hypothetical protein